MVRVATPKDVEKIKEILKKEFESQEISEDPFTHYYVYEENSSFAFLSFSNLFDHIDLNYIWVNESSRGKKIASQLLEILIDYTKKENIFQIVLEVNEKNEIAKSLYKKYGFQEKAIRKNYYGNENGLLMVLEIR